MTSSGRGWVSAVGAWFAGGVERVDAVQLAGLMDAASRPTFGFFFMLAMATAIATFGLVGNSAPAIIGAMIIAPLMSPIVSLAYAIIAIDWRILGRSVAMVVLGVLLVVALAALVTEAIGLRIAGSEILNRTAPNLLDLGVAMAAGAAGAFAHTRQGILNSIAGVAIAVALVPPLAVVGIGLALGQETSAAVGLSLTEFGSYSGGTSMAAGAFLLFVTNLIGIVVCGAIVLIAQRYGHWKRALIGLAVLLGLSFAIIEPLHTQLYRLYVKSTVLRLVASLREHEAEMFHGRAKLEALNVDYEEGLVTVNIDLFVPQDERAEVQRAIDVFQDYLATYLEQNVVVTADVVFVQLEEVRSTNRNGEPEAVEEEVLDAIE